MPPLEPVQTIPPERARKLILQAASSSKAMRTSGYINDSPALSVKASIQDLFTNYAPLGYMLPFETLDYIELLATYNPDYSQAVDNVRTLANSGHQLFVEGNSDLATRQLRERIEQKARTIQEQHGGVDGIIDKMLDQAATYGAMCGEWVLSDTLDDVVDFADINPKTIRFFWDKEQQKWAPYQKVSMAQAEEAQRNGQRVINGIYIELNPLTFKYYAFDAAPGSPYGTPPFVASLAPIAIQRDMVGNLAQIVKKMGLLAVVDMTVQALEPQRGESEDAFQVRAGSYLDNYVAVVEEMARDGGIVHFDDVKVAVTQLAGNMSGAKEIFTQNEEQVFSGLKSMPSVQGRSYSTTETYAGVAYDIIIRNTLKYQRAAKRMIEHGYWTMVQLWGVETKAKSISIKFNDNKTIYRLQNAQAERLEIENGYRKWRMGLINQQAFAQDLGINEVATPMEEPPKDVYNNAAEVDDTEIQPEEGTEDRSDELHNREGG